jgi:hypothetical protein
MADEIYADDSFKLNEAVDRAQQLRDKYRFVFGTELGSQVLSDILKMCHFAMKVDPDNKNEIIAHNLAVEILAKCGVYDGDNFEKVIRNILGIAASARVS